MPSIGAWLSPCGVDVGCDEEGLAARVRFRSNGLLNELLQPRAALDLWDSTTNATASDPR